LLVRNNCDDAKDIFEIDVGGAIATANLALRTSYRMVACAAFQCPNPGIRTEFPPALSPFPTKRNFEGGDSPPEIASLAKIRLYDGFITIHSDQSRILMTFSLNSADEPE